MCIALCVVKTRINNIDYIPKSQPQHRESKKKQRETNHCNRK